MNSSLYLRAGNSDSRIETWLEVSHSSFRSAFRAPERFWMQHILREGFKLGSIAPPPVLSVASHEPPNFDRIASHRSPFCPVSI